MGRRRRKQLLDDLKEKKGYSKLTEESQIALCGEPALQRLWTYRKTDYRMNGLLI